MPDSIDKTRGILDGFDNREIFPMVLITEVFLMVLIIERYSR
jgi:hypothetical protein